MSNTPITLRKIKRPGPKTNGREEWALRWYDSEGRHRCERIGDVRTMPKRQAEVIRRKRQTDMEARRFPRDKPRSMTLQQFAEYHKQAIGNDRKPSTRYEYELSLRYAMEAMGKDFPLRKLSPADAGRIKRHLNGVEATRAKHLSRLNAIFNRAVKWELIDKNPFKDQPVPRFGSRKMRIFKPHEIEAILDAAPTLWWRAFLLVGFTTGLRKEEIANLMWLDVDLEDMFVHVAAKQAKRMTGNDGVRFCTLAWTPKDYEIRTVPIPQRTVNILRELRQKADDSPYVFVSLIRLALINAKLDSGVRRNRAETLNNVLRDFKRIQNHAAKRIQSNCWQLGTIHDLRRTYGTMMAEAVPMHVLSQLMGHSDISTTAKYYLHVGEHHAGQIRRALNYLH